MTSLSLRIHGSPLGPPTRRLVQLGRLARWRLNGRRGLTPALYKQREIAAYGRRFGLHVFIETGSYFGDTLAGVVSHFRRAYSIELDAEYHEIVSQRFAGDPRVEVMLGDSGDLLPGLLADINEPCLFWLDARGETETPFPSELHAVLEHHVEAHILLIDDARLLNGSRGYPTLSELRNEIGVRRPSWQVEVRDDIVRITPG